MTASATTLESSAAPPALDYAPRPSRRRRVLRRALRWWPAWTLLVLVGLGIGYGPEAWRHYQLMRLQAACLTAQMPQDRPAMEEDPAAARALVAARPGEYALDPLGRAVRSDPRWAALLAATGWGARPSIAPGWLLPTTFCHERQTPDGRRRLVVLEWARYVTVVEPAGWLGGAPRLVRLREVIDWDEPSWSAMGRISNLSGPSRTAAGLPDPADPTRFTVPFVISGVTGTWECRLGDDEQVTVRILDPEGSGRGWRRLTRRPASSRSHPDEQSRAGLLRSADPARARTLALLRSTLSDRAKKPRALRPRKPSLSWHSWLHGAFGQNPGHANNRASSL